MWLIVTKFFFYGAAPRAVDAAIHTILAHIVRPSTSHAGPAA